MQDEMQFVFYFYCRLGYYGLAITCALFIITACFAIKVEKHKKNNDIQTFKEVVSFTEGKLLDEIEKAREYGKRPYQKFLFAFMGAVIAAVVSLISIWLLKSFIF